MMATLREGAWWLVILVTASTPRVAVTQPADGTSEASLEVHETVDTLRQRLLDVPHWPDRFSDVTAAHLESSVPGRSQVEFTSRTFRHTLGAVVTSERDSVVVTVTRGPAAITIRQQWTLTPLAGGTGTRVTVRLLAQVGGWMALVFPEWRLRALRAEKLQADLVDLAR